MKRQRLRKYARIPEAEGNRWQRVQARGWHRWVTWAADVFNPRLCVSNRRRDVQRASR